MKRERRFSLVALFNQYLPVPIGDQWRREATLVRVKRAVILHEMEPTKEHEALILTVSKHAIAAGWTREEIVTANKEALQLRKERFGAAVVSLGLRKAVKLDLGAEATPGLTNSQKKA